MRFLFFLGPSARGLRPQAVGERTFSPVTTTTIRQGRGHNVCPAVSRDGVEQAVDVCFDLTCRPGGRLLAGL